mmetsp:Transcript_76279/g.204034  ORF Transcript_76279/g.204034 Transcript_76279/m.204034 type:complete len:263 (+) Transcript_76279:1010-1798(+)
MHFVRRIQRPDAPAEIPRLRAGPPQLLPVVHRPEHHLLRVPGVLPVAGVRPGEQAGVACVDAVAVAGGVGVAEGAASVRGDAEGGGRSGGAVAIGADAAGGALNLAELSPRLLPQILRLQEQRVHVPQPGRHHALPVLRPPVGLPLLQRVLPGVEDRRLLHTRDAPVVFERIRIKNHRVLAVGTQARGQSGALDGDQPPFSVAGAAVRDGDRVGGGGALGDLGVVEGVAEVVGAAVGDGDPHCLDAHLLGEEHTENPRVQVY